MTALFWQTSLLLLAAYLLGAWSGCMMRRLLFSGRTARTAGLGGEAVMATPDAAPPPAPVRRVDPEPAAARIAPARPSPVELDPAGLYARARDGGRPLESAPPRPQQEVNSEPTVREPAEAAAPSSGSAAFPGGLESAAARAEAREPAAPAMPMLPPSSGTAGAVGGLESVRAARVDTPAPRQAGIAPPPSSPILPVATGSSGASYVSAPIRPATVSTPDDLTRIRAIDEAMQSRLSQLGVTRFEQIAGWRPADVRRVGQELGFKGRIEQENWIEQAQILARNGETWYSERKARGAPAMASPTPGEGSRVTVPMQARQDTATDGLAKTVGRDILQRITGISAEVEKTLNDQGVTRYTHIAGWSQAEVAKFDQRLGLAGRIARENWLEQAQILARGGATAFSREYDRRAHEETLAEPPRPPKLADAIRDAAAKSGNEPEATGNGGRVDLSMLRSVRSEAFRGPDSPPAGSVPAAVVNRVGRGVAADDLKRIRGVGVLIEKRLNAMGITTYEQIANWADADIARVSQTLDFKGRIERESWVEQARILASGGQTDFSRRVDRGDAGVIRR